MKPIQRVTGGLRLGINLGYDHTWASYSAYFSRPAGELFRLAGGQGQAAG